MNIRQATKRDIDTISRIDKFAYGKYGGSTDYFAKKLSAFPEGMLVAEENGKVTGAVMFEALEKDGIPEDFGSISLLEPISGRWMYTVVFTTATNYANKKSDSQLLLAAENVAKKLGCIEACVPLTKNHPFEANGVFEFWESHGYKRIGETRWVPNANENFECWFYKKKL